MGFWSIIAEFDNSSTLIITGVLPSQQVASPVIVKMAKAGALKKDEKSFCVLYCCTHCDGKFESEDALQNHIKTCKVDISWIKQEPEEVANQAVLPQLKATCTTNMQTTTAQNLDPESDPFTFTATDTNFMEKPALLSKTKCEAEQNDQSGILFQIRESLPKIQQNLPQGVKSEVMASIDTSLSESVNQMQMACEMSHEFVLTQPQMMKFNSAALVAPQYHNAAQSLTASEILRQRFQKTQASPSFNKDASKQETMSEILWQQFRNQRIQAAASFSGSSAVSCCSKRSKKSFTSNRRAVQTILPKITPKNGMICYMEMDNLQSNSDPSLPKIERIYYTSKTDGNPVTSQTTSASCLDLPMSFAEHQSNEGKSESINKSAVKTKEKLNNINGVPVNRLHNNQSVSVSKAGTISHNHQGVFQTVQTLQMPHAFQHTSQTLIQAPHGLFQMPQSFLQNPQTLIQTTGTFFQTTQPLLQNAPALFKPSVVQPNLFQIPAVQQNSENSLVLSAQAVPQIMPVLTSPHLSVQSSFIEANTISFQPDNLPAPNVSSDISCLSTAKLAQVYTSVTATNGASESQTETTQALKPAVTAIQQKSQVVNNITCPVPPGQQLQMAVSGPNNVGFVFIPGGLQILQNTIQQGSLAGLENQPVSTSSNLSVPSGISSQQQCFAKQNSSSDVVLLSPVVTQGTSQQPSLISPSSDFQAAGILSITSIAGSMKGKNNTSKLHSSSATRKQPVGKPTHEVKLIKPIFPKLHVSDEKKETFLTSSLAPAIYNLDQGTYEELTDNTLVNIANLLLFDDQKQGGCKDRGPVILVDGRVFVPVAYTGPYTLKNQTATFPGDVVWIFFDKSGPKIVSWKLESVKPKVIMLPLKSGLPKEAVRQVREMLNKAKIQFPLNSKEMSSHNTKHLKVDPYRTRAEQILLSKNQPVLPKLRASSSLSQSQPPTSDLHHDKVSSHKKYTGTLADSETEPFLKSPVHCLPKLQSSIIVPEQIKSFSGKEFIAGSDLFEDAKEYKRRSQNISDTTTTDHLLPGFDRKGSKPCLTVKATASVVKRALEAFVNVEKLLLTEAQQHQLQAEQVAKRMSVKFQYLEQKRKSLTKINPQKRLKKWKNRGYNLKEAGREPQSKSEQVDSHSISKPDNQDLMVIESDRYNDRMSKKSEEKKGSFGKNIGKKKRKRSMKLTWKNDDEFDSDSSGERSKKRRRSETNHKMGGKEIDLCRDFVDLGVRRSIRIFCRPKANYLAQEEFLDYQFPEMVSQSSIDTLSINNLDNAEDSDVGKTGGFDTASMDSSPVLACRSLGKHAGFDVYVETANTIDNDDNSKKDTDEEDKDYTNSSVHQFLSEHRGDFEKLVLKEVETNNIAEGVEGHILYFCKICGSFQTSSDCELLSHLQQHYNGELTCKRCKFKRCKFNAASVQELVEHEALEHTGKPLYHCHKCQTPFFSQSIFQNHLKRHSTVITCKMCGKQFPNEGGLKEHIEREHAQEYICHLCNQLFVSEDKIRSHYTECKDGYQCCLCYVKMLDLSALRQHLQKEHDHQGGLQSVCTNIVEPVQNSLETTHLFI